MSYKFEDTDKEANDFKERIPFGISEVQITGVSLGETEAGKEYIEVGVITQDALEDSARVWFVGGASKFSFDTLRSIVVHTAKTDADKEKARVAVEACVDTEALVELINAKCIGGQVWFTKYYNATRSYTGSDGKTYRSVDKAVLGYQPKLKPELMPTAKSNDEITAENVATVFPGSEDVTGSGPDVPVW